MCWKTPPKATGAVGFAQHANVSVQVVSDLSRQWRQWTNFEYIPFRCIHDSCNKNPSLFHHCLAICDMFLFPLSLWCHTTNQNKLGPPWQCWAATAQPAMSTMFSRCFYCTILGISGRISGVISVIAQWWCWTHVNRAAMMTCMSRMARDHGFGHFVGTSENFHKIRLCSILAGKSHPYMYNVYIYI